MKISDEGIALIKRFEGVRLQAYQVTAAGEDRAGIWTIGYGHTSGVYKGMVITPAQAEAFLREDLATFEAAVDGLGRTWTSGQYSALVSFAYNCGAGNLRTLCKNRDAATIAEKMLLYNKGVNGKVLQGLVARRNAERQLFLSESEDKKDDDSYYCIGKIYTLHSDLFVRMTACGVKKNYTQITSGAKKHAYSDVNGKAILKEGTRVTCLELKTVGEQQWMRIPSGWVCAVSTCGKRYIK